jgi:hypothetical protein
MFAIIFADFLFCGQFHQDDYTWLFCANILWYLSFSPTLMLKFYCPTLFINFGQVAIILDKAPLFGAIVPNLSITKGVK